MLSERLMAVAQMVTPGLKVADIGCDHAYLPIYLVRENVSPYVIAADINSGPVAKARDNIREAGLEGRIEVRQGDGLSVIEPGDAGSVVLAGMGGRLMMKILSEGAAVLEEVYEIIMEPQSEVSELRHYLQDNGYMIISEDMVNDGDKFYPVIKAVPGKTDENREVMFRYGKVLLREGNPVLHDFLLLERQYCSNLLEELAANIETPNVAARMEELRTDLALNEEALRLIAEPELS